MSVPFNVPVRQFVQDMWSVPPCPPGIEVDDFIADPKTLLKPGWDYLWQAAGYPNSR